ncbi:MAG: hypothetical protein JW969_12630 [Spirochaetales bacterium]|nr:hypothetical protein [Spirochaetales bacterium]
MNCVTLLFSQFYADYPEEEKQKLSQEYFRLGTYLLEIGRQEGIKYIKMAYDMNPELGVSAVDDSYLESNDIKYRFRRMVYSFVAGDFNHFFTFFGKSVYIAIEQKTYIQWDWQDRITGYSGNVSFPGFSPSMLFDLDSVAVYPERSYYILETYSQNSEIRDYYPFFYGKVYFLYGLSGKKWQICAIFDTKPDKNLLNSYEFSHDTAEITDRFLSALKLFSIGDFEAMASLFTEDIYLVDLKTSITRKELSFTLKGLIEDKSAPLDKNIPDFNFIQNHVRVMKLSEKPDFFNEESGFNPIYVLVLDEDLLNTENLHGIWQKYGQYFFVSENGIFRIMAMK